jgi:hypothetical protein
MSMAISRMEGFTEVIVSDHRPGQQDISALEQWHEGQFFSESL